MLYKLYISRDKKLVTVAPSGTYTIDDIKNLILIILNDPLYNQKYSQIFDLREMNYTPVFDEIRDLIEFILMFSNRMEGKIAFLIEKEFITALFSLIVSKISEAGIKTEIFRKTADALNWINNPETITFD